MKKSVIWVLLTITLVFVAFVGGMYVGRNFYHTDIHVGTVTIPQTVPSSAPTTVTPPVGSTTTSPTATEPLYPININTATVAQLDLLPEIGPVLAQRIVDYRNEYGPFERVEDLLYVNGIGEKTLAKILDLITV